MLTLFIDVKISEYLVLTKVVCFTRLLKCLRSLYGKSVDTDQTASIGAVFSGSTVFASILNLSVMLGNYLQQRTSADDIFRCIIFLGAFRVNTELYFISPQHNHYREQSGSVVECLT